MIKNLLEIMSDLLPIEELEHFDREVYNRYKEEQTELNYDFFRSKYMSINVRRHNRSSGREVTQI